MPIAAGLWLVWRAVACRAAGRRRPRARTPASALPGRASSAERGRGADREPPSRRNRIGRRSSARGPVAALARDVALCDSVARSVPPVPGQEWIAWLAAWGFPVTLAPPPASRPGLSPPVALHRARWTVVAALILVGVLGSAIGNAFTPSMADDPDPENPVGIPAFTGSRARERPDVAWFLLRGRRHRGRRGSGAAAARAARRASSACRPRGSPSRRPPSWPSAGSSWQSSCRRFAGELTKYAIFAALLLVPVAIARRDPALPALRHRPASSAGRIATAPSIGDPRGDLFAALVLVLQAVLGERHPGRHTRGRASTLVASPCCPAGPRARARRGRPAVRPAPLRPRRDRRRHSADRLRDEVETSTASSRATSRDDATKRCDRPPIALWLRAAHDAGR